MLPALRKRQIIQAQIAMMVLQPMLARLCLTGGSKSVKITNRKNIAGKIHYMVHWSDGTKSYEPEENITDGAKAAYHARCQARRKPRDHQYVPHLQPCTPYLN